MIIKSNNLAMLWFATATGARDTTLQATRLGARKNCGLISLVGGTPTELARQQPIGLGICMPQVNLPFQFGV